MGGGDAEQGANKRQRTLVGASRGMGADRAENTVAGRVRASRLGSGPDCGRRWSWAGAGG